MTSLRASGLNALVLASALAVGANGQPGKMPAPQLATGATIHTAQTPGRVVRVKTLADLKHLSAGELKALFAGGRSGPEPVGFARGQILHLPDSLPLLKISLTRAVWRGKYFKEEGIFVNEWTGFRAIKSRSYVGPSHLDGRPALILEYHETIPFFGNMRDELREITPGLYLSMVFERPAPHTFRGIIGLELLPEPEQRWPKQ